jgi:hypothetical protein
MLYIGSGCYTRQAEHSLIYPNQTRPADPFFLLFDRGWPTFGAQEIAKRHGAAVYVSTPGSDVSV